MVSNAHRERELNSQHGDLRRRIRTSSTSFLDDILEEGD